jgi:hypothetical protein
VFYLYAIQKYSDDWEEIPETQREWWNLVISSENKQILLDWYNNYRYATANGFKIVEAKGTLPEFFYPRREIKRQTNAGKLLRAIKWEYTLYYEEVKNSKTT